MAQLGARLNGIQKVRGSNPLSSTSTIMKPSGDPGGFFRFGFISLDLGFIFNSCFPNSRLDDCARPGTARFDPGDAWRVRQGKGPQATFLDKNYQRYEYCMYQYCGLVAGPLLLMNSPLQIWDHPTKTS